MIDKRAFWNGRILGWEKKRYRESFFFYSSIYYRRKNCLKLISELVSPGQSIVELGCGSGTLVENLSGDINYHGYDFSEVAIDEARDKFKHKKRFSFSVMDLTLLEDDITADLIVGLGFIDWLEKNEFKNILEKCDSPLLLFSYSERRRHWFRRIYDLYSKLFFQQEYRPQFYTTEEIKQLLNSRGYQIQQVITGSGMLFGGMIVARK